MLHAKSEPLNFKMIRDEPRFALAWDRPKRPDKREHYIYDPGLFVTTKCSRKVKIFLERPRRAGRAGWHFSAVVG
jgi:hypothetical protein